MLIAVYDPTGTIFKGLEGPSLEWAEALVAENYPGDWLFMETDHFVDGSVERVHVTAEPHVLVPFTPVQTPEQIKAEILASTQTRLDEFAKTRGYDSILSAATYATSAVEQFAAEGQRAAELRDATWSALYQMLAEVLDGTRPMPGGYAEIEGELPALVWST